MFNFYRKRHPFLKAISIFLISAIFAGAIFIVFLENIIVFTLNRSGEVKVLYDKWGKNPFDLSYIQGLKLEIDDIKLMITAENTYLSFYPQKSFDEKRLVLSCKMQGVSFRYMNNENNITFNAEDIFSIPLSPEQVYGDMLFNVYIDSETLEVEGFSATSKDIKMKGNYTLDRVRDVIVVDLKISFSPDISMKFPEVVRGSFLSLEDDGWYSTIIDFKGPAVLLKALYQI